MKIQEAVDHCLEYHKANSKKRTLDGHGFVLKKFSAIFGDREVESISSDEILLFLNRLSEGRKQATN